MPIESPTQLVNEFKKSGEFDRLRRELLAQVAQGTGMTTLKTRVQEVAHQRFTSDPKLSFMTLEAIYRELMQEMERFPVVDRVAEDVQMLSDPSFTESIRKSVRAIVSDGKGQTRTFETKDDKTEVTEATSSTMQTRFATSSHPEQANVLQPSVTSVVSQLPNSNSTTPLTTLEDSPEQILEASVMAKAMNPLGEPVIDTSMSSSSIPGAGDSAQEPAANKDAMVR